MRGDERDAPARQMRPHGIGEERDAARVERDGGLVEEPELAARDEEPREPEPPLLPGAERARRAPARSARRKRSIASALVPVP
jgi:hypothetical protein